MIPPSSLRLFRNLAFAGLLLILNANVRAADGIWNGSVSTSWDNADNWTDGLPGAAATSEPGANADTATFNLSSSVASARRSVVVPTVSGGAWSLKSIAFSGPTGIIYTIGANAGPALWLTSGGSISYLPSVGSTTTQIIAAPAGSPAHGRDRGGRLHLHEFGDQHRLPELHRSGLRRRDHAGNHAHPGRLRPWLDRHQYQPDYRTDLGRRRRGRSFHRQERRRYMVSGQ